MASTEVKSGSTYMKQSIENAFSGGAQFLLEGISGLITTMLNIK